MTRYLILPVCMRACVCVVRVQLPLLSNIHEFLKKANDAGSISRQEAVSMVPPLFLDVHPEHRVSFVTHLCHQYKHSD